MWYGFVVYTVFTLSPIKFLPSPYELHIILHNLQ